MNWQIHRHVSVASTMQLAAGMPVGSVVVADAQTAGIGRHGHTWDSQPDVGLYASIVLDHHPVLTLALGLAAQAGIRDATSLSPDIRWPNDLMLSGRKLGGILVQLDGDTAIAGVGINIGQRAFSPELSPIATSLALETNLDFRPDDILDALLARIPEVLRLSRSKIVSRWETHSSWARGRSVEVDVGERLVTGVTDGLDAAGYLRVREPNGSIEIIIAGGVRPFHPGSTYN